LFIVSIENKINKKQHEKKEEEEEEEFLSFSYYLNPIWE